MNDVNCNTSVKPLNTVQKIDRCLSADFESPFSRRSLSTMEKIKIASADLLFGYKEVLSVKNKLLSELINDRFFGYCTYPNALENVSLAMAKTYTLILKLAETFDDGLYHKFGIGKIVSFENPIFEEDKPIFKFTVSLNLAINGNSIAKPITIETSVLLADTVTDPVFKPKQITKRGIVSSDINYYTKFDIDGFIKSYKSVEEGIKPEEIADDIIKDIALTADKINRIFFTYLMHVDLSISTALKDIRNRHCESCGQFGCRAHSCNPLFPYEFDDNSRISVSKDTMINAVIDIFNYYELNDRSAEGGVIWNKYHWNILTGTDSDIYKFIFNEMFEKYMIQALQYILKEISGYNV